MKKFLTILAILIPVLTGAQERPAYPLIRENLDRAACNMHSYEFRTVADTPAPEGYVPVYISHYGRHGSRHDVSDTSFDGIVAQLTKFDSSGVLTAAGKRFMLDIMAVAKEHEGMGGELTPRGGREHQALAERMYDRFPGVFSPGKEVDAVASTVQRCIVSMANFTSSLKGKQPGIVLHLTSGERYSPVIRLTSPTSGSGTAARGNGNSGGLPRRPDLQGNYGSFLSGILTDPSVLGKDHDSFIRDAYKAGGLCQDLDFLGVDIFRNYFTTDELYSLWWQENNSLYGRWGNSIENGDAYSRKALPLLMDIIGKADDALKEGSDRAADLRFGHDMGYMALCSLLHVDTKDGERYRTEEASQHWFSFEMVPMAANVQFIFYRNSEGDVLVKLLRNEEEVNIPGLDAVSGPYYRWEDFKGAFMPGRDDMVRERLADAEGADVLVSAHFGDWHGTFENSLHAIQKAVDKGASIVELQVKKTADGQMICFSDDTVDRLLEGSGRVSGMTLAQIRSLKPREYRGPEDWAVIPTLAEAIAFSRGKILLHVSLNEFYDDILDVIRSEHAEGHVVLKSRKVPDPGFLYLPVFDVEHHDDLKALEEILALNPVGVEIHFTDDNAPLLRPALEMAKGKTRIAVNTSGIKAGSHRDPEKGNGSEADRIWGELIRQGATIIFTDQIKPLMKYLAH